MIKTKMTTAFQQEIVDFLKTRIMDVKGSSVHGADFCHFITDDERAAGAWITYIDRAEAFVKKYRKDALIMIDYYHEKFGNDYIDKKLEIGEYGEPWDYFTTEYDEDGETANTPVFDEIDLILANGKSEPLTFFMLFCGVAMLIPHIPCVEDAWDNIIFIDDDFIDAFISELSK